MSPDTPSTEQSLVESAQRDPSKFAELYRRNVTRVYAYFWVRFHNREDLTSRVFLRALKGISGFEWRGVPFSAWLLKIASNVMADEMKNSGKRAEDIELNHDEIGFTPEIDRRVLVAELVANLPEDQRRVIVLRFIEGKAGDEIARTMNRTIGAVKQLQLRAMKTLRKELARTNG